MTRFSAGRSCTPFQSHTISTCPPTAKPFLKWVGGKRRLTGELIQHLPPSFCNYYEPFAGSACLFFALQPQLTKVFLSDLNQELMLSYQMVQQKVQRLIQTLISHQQQHSQAYFYKVRGMHHLQDPVQIAARTIYLNKTCFNGLYRVNRKGLFNVPIGCYTNPQIVNATNLLACSKALRKVSLSCIDYKEITPGAGDFVYFDPPYHSVNKSSFTAYTSSRFAEKEQSELAQFCTRLHHQGVKLIVSNHDTAFIRQLYHAPYFKINIIQAARSIGASKASRQPVAELLITNY